MYVTNPCSHHPRPPSQNLLDACLGGLLWYLLGFPLAYGHGNAFVGGSWDAVSGCVDYGMWLFLWAFAVTAGTIVSGALAERCQFITYLIYTLVLSAFIYPVVVHWVWSDQGWLKAAPDGMMPGNGFHDFAGSGVVHVTGGMAGLMGAIVIGPRVGRFRDDDGTPVNIPGHSTTLSCLGTFILWFGWYGFNAVSTLAFSNMYLASRICVNTTLAAASGGLGTLLLHVVHGHRPDVTPALNGILGGLVAITAGCDAVEPYAAIAIGTLAAPCYYYSAAALLRLRIDDPIGASPVHCFCGVWGVLSVGLFGTETYMGSASWGVLYGGSGLQLGLQAAGLAAIAAWTGILSFSLFKVLNHYNLLRVHEVHEVIGLDVTHHGGHAYYRYDGTPELHSPVSQADSSRPTTAGSLRKLESLARGHVTELHPM